MDRREWDFGARLPEDRHGTEDWSTQNDPEHDNKPEPGAIVDTGSLEPSPEAVAWAQRADAWAQPQADPAASASRWDDAAPTVKQTYPLGSLGWHTDPAEWLAAEQTAHQRQATERRFPSGDRGWRPTREAWQSGGAEEFRPPVDPSPAPQHTVPPATVALPWQPADTADPVGSSPWHQPPAVPAPPAQRTGEASSWRWLGEPEPNTYGSPRSAGPDDGRDPRGPAIERRRAAEPGPAGAGWDGDAVDEAAGTVAFRPPPASSERAGPRHRSLGSEWRDGTDAPSRHGHIDDRSDPASWRYHTDVPHADATRSGSHDDAVTDWRDRSDGWRFEPDPGGWSGGEERTVRRRGPADDEDRNVPGRRDAGPGTDYWRRDPPPAADPWALHATDTGYLPPSWEQAGTYAGTWDASPSPLSESAEDRTRTPTSDANGRVYGRRHRDEDQSPLDADVWHRDPGRDEDQPPLDGHGWHRDPGPAGDGANRPSGEDRLGGDYPDRQPNAEAVTEVRQAIDPKNWQRDHGQGDQGARGAAGYREGDVRDWRPEHAADTELGHGGPRRFPTNDLPPFQPSGPAPADHVHSYPAQGSRPDLLAVNRNSARWDDAPDSRWPPRGAVTNSDEHRSAGSLPDLPGRSNLLEPDEDLEDSTAGALAAVGYTVIWYGVPVILFMLYMLVLNSDEKAHALSTLTGAAPQFGLSLALSMVLAVVLRRLSGSWRAASVGLAAAVMGGGLATVLTSAISGNPLS